MSEGLFRAELLMDTDKEITISYQSLPSSGYRKWRTLHRPVTYIAIAVGFVFMAVERFWSLFFGTTETVGFAWRVAEDSNDEYKAGRD